MHKLYGILTILFWSVSTSSFCQTYPNVEFGAIFSLNYIKSQPDETPLLINHGNGSFLNFWSFLLNAQIKDNLSLYTLLEAEDGIEIEIYGLSAIYQTEWLDQLNIEIGKFLIPFGTALQRRWDSENPFVGLPLMYEYHTPISSMELPGSEHALLLNRGRGLNLNYNPRGESLGTKKVNSITSDNSDTKPLGLEIISHEAYVTGVQVFGTAGQFGYHLGAANGSLSNPVDINNSNGVQLLGRLDYQINMGLDLGVSFSVGSYLDHNVTNTQLQNAGKSVEDFKQLAVGFDVTYSLGHLELHSELILNRWQTPFLTEDLDLMAFYLDSKYTFWTRFYGAGRFSLINFSQIDDLSDVDIDGNLRESWDYDIYQMDLAFGYHVNRNAIVKIMGRLNKTRDVAGGDPRDNRLALQMAVFF
ncbi:MAG: hypothetical protein ACE5HS_20460 [bacterium]